MKTASVHMKWSEDAGCKVGLPTPTKMNTDTASRSSGNGLKQVDRRTEQAKHLKSVLISAYYIIAAMYVKLLRQRRIPPWRFITLLSRIRDLHCQRRRVR